ncbi:MAG: hypothetical protein U9O98_02520 [Asgard group archaeon]|nr:hypothetical protein [Asgard group archaeon]
MLEEFSNYSTNKSDIFEIVANFERNVPNFYDEGVCEIKYIPVENGEIRVFHHKPEKVKTKRPIVFAPGFATAPYIWREFHYPQHDFLEYYHIETRDKKSSKIKNRRNADFSIEQIAKDIGTIINYLNLAKKDYVLVGTCMCGGAILTGLINEFFNPPTTIVLDPFTKWTQNKFLVKTIMPIIPAPLLGGLKYLFAKLILANMKNEAQKKRNMATIEEAVPWIWKKFSTQNINYDITTKLANIKQQIYIFHGPPDKYHPEGFIEIAKKIPNARYFHIPIKEEYRELLIGIIGTIFASITKEDDLPMFIKKYEVEIS